MEQIAGFPYFRIEFTKDGKVFKPEQRDDILENVPAGTTDIVVASHGWNNDINDAQTMYKALFAQIANELSTSPAKNRKIAVVGVFWPSKKFAEEDLVPGGGASAGGTDDVKLQRRLDNLAATLGPGAAAEVAKAKVAAAQLNNNASQAAYVEALRRALVMEVGKPGPSERQDDAADLFFSETPEAIFDALKVPPGILPAAPKPAGTGGATGVGSVPSGLGGGTGGGAGIGSFFRGVRDRALDIANFTTYYLMKKRAGVVGTAGLGPLVAQIRKKYPARIHLVGHSFGGRVVTAATDAQQDAGAISSLTLLQTAYSHNALGDDEKGLVGFFRGVVTGKKVKGPIVISHTINDRAVGIAYPIASRLARDNSKALGDRNDPYGGLGRNGALFAKASEEFRLTKDVVGFAFKSGKIYNLNADDVIKNHGDVERPAVARALLCAMATEG
jgi:pimeloyl-ACP methyl ester carboxylesterase